MLYWARWPINRDRRPTVEQEDAMSENTGTDQARFEELETRLHELLRSKYHEHWRHKDGGPRNAESQARLAEVQEEIRRTFDAIRLIDKKYKIPSLDMHPDR